MTKKILCMDSFIIIHFAYKKTLPDGSVSQ